MCFCVGRRHLSKTSANDFFFISSLYLQEEGFCCGQRFLKVLPLLEIQHVPWLDTHLYILCCSFAASIVRLLILAVLYRNTQSWLFYTKLPNIIFLGWKGPTKINCNPIVIDAVFNVLMFNLWNNCIWFIQYYISFQDLFSSSYINW